MAKKQSMESMEGSVMAASKKSKSKGKKWEVGSGKWKWCDVMWFFLLNVLIDTNSLLFLSFITFIFTKKVITIYLINHHIIYIWFIDLLDSETDLNYLRGSILLTHWTLLFMIWPSHFSHVLFRRLRH